MTPIFFSIHIEILYLQIDLERSTSIFYACMPNSFKYTLNQSKVHFNMHVPKALL